MFEIKFANVNSAKANSRKKAYWKLSSYCVIKKQTTNIKSCADSQSLFNAVYSLNAIW